MIDLQAKYSQQTDYDKNIGLSSRFYCQNSVDNWRHRRMLDMPRPIYQWNSRARWMTVGDGRYGSDAAYLIENNLEAVATSLTDENLKEAARLGYIREYQAENAEHLSFTDDAFDFVLCKESYHHFPRPPIALYEMLRVARRGVVLIEPIDNPRLLDGIKKTIKRVMRGDREYQFEPSGNFLYRISIREIEKLHMAMGGEVIAFKGFNDFYLPALSGYPTTGANIGFWLTKFGIFIQNSLAKLGLMGWGLGCVIVFKRRPDDTLIEVLKDHRFKVIDLPKNPYA